MHRTMNGMKALVVGAALSVTLAVGAVPAEQTATGEAWSGRWIRAPWSTERDGTELDASKPMPVFRREFTVRKMSVRATLRIAGLGQYEARIGSSGGMQMTAARGLHQAWTDYRKTVTYESYDVTRMVAPGQNVLSVMLGNGMYNVQKTKGRYTKFEGSFGPPKLIAELRLQYSDGKTETVGSGIEWKVLNGPVTFSSTYGGEDFDARKEQVGWDVPNFDDTAWPFAIETEGPGGQLTAALAPEVREGLTHLVGKTTEVRPGIIVYDLQQNFAGVPLVRLSGPRGAVLKLTPGELLNPDGSVSQGSSGGPMWWSYTLRGGARAETWTPQFGYYGFRYVQAEWSKGSGKIESLSGLEWHSASPVTGSFASSDGTLNSIHSLIVNSMHNNEVSIFTDCPHREKLGWLEETHLVASGLMFNNDLHGLYAATEKNIGDAQHKGGGVATTAPQYTVFGSDAQPSVFDDSPEWGSASVLGPWAAYRFYGSLGELALSYPVMRAYVKYLQGKAGTGGAGDGIVEYGLGDWYDIGPGEPGVSKNTSPGVTGTLMLYEDAVAMSKIAALLGHAKDAVSYATLAASEKDAFNKRFWHEDKGWYDRGSQTANAMALALDVVPWESRAVVLANLVADIQAHNNHMTTGEVGYPYMLRALMEGGRNDVVLAMMLRKDAPSYGSQLSAGATSLTEAWDANPRSSQDHFMLGGAEEWFYRGLGGIDFDMSRSAEERITIRPQLVGGLKSVKCSYASVLGKIRSEWRQDEGTTSIDIAIPPGARATLILPVKMVANISNIHAVNGRGPDLQETRRDGSVVVYRAGAGVYQFREAESGR